MAYKSRKMRRAAGGKAVRKEHDEHWMNAQGSPEQHEAESKDDSFKRGGSHHKRAHGGKVDGEHAKHHLGKRARGGRMEKKEEEEKRARGGAVRRARGGESPFSTARHSTGPSDKEGSPGEQAPFS